MFWGKEPTKGTLEGRKVVVIDGSKYVIRKVNPLLDFNESGMPQIFAHFVSRRKAEKADDPRRHLKDLYSVLEAGVVFPALVPDGKDGITARDIFRDMDHGMRLYWEIITHSMNKFKGLRGIFFSVMLRSKLRMLWRSVTADSRAKLFSEIVSV